MWLTSTSNVKTMKLASSKPDRHWLHNCIPLSPGYTEIINSKSNRSHEHFDLFWLRLARSYHLPALRNILPHSHAVYSQDHPLPRSHSYTMCKYILIRQCSSLCGSLTLWLETNCSKQTDHMRHQILKHVRGYTTEGKK